VDVGSQGDRSSDEEEGDGDRIDQQMGDAGDGAEEVDERLWDGGEDDANGEERKDGGFDDRAVKVGIGKGEREGAWFGVWRVPFCLFRGRFKPLRVAGLRGWGVLCGRGAGHCHQVLVLYKQPTEPASKPACVTHLSVSTTQPQVDDKSQLDYVPGQEAPMDEAAEEDGTRPQEGRPQKQEEKKPQVGAPGASGAGLLLVCRWSLFGLLLVFRWAASRTLVRQTSLSCNSLPGEPLALPCRPT
jgi:hypothetical protein